MLKRAPILARLFLNPDDVADSPWRAIRRRVLFLGRIELLEKHDGSGVVFSFFALGLEFVADFSGADQDAVGFGDFCIGKYVLEIFLSEVCDRR